MYIRQIIPGSSVQCNSFHFISSILLGARLESLGRLAADGDGHVVGGERRAHRSAPEAVDGGGDDAVALGGTLGESEGLCDVVEDVGVFYLFFISC